jgi:hypothetical protein
MDVDSVPVEKLKDHDSLTIEEFCAVEKISRTSFFKMQRKGIAPETFRIPGMAIVRVTAQARQEWRARMAALKDDPAIEKKKAENIERSRRAGIQKKKHKARRVS